MADEYNEFFDFLEDDALTIPGVKSVKHPTGKTYTIPSPDFETGAKLSALAEIATKVNKGVEVAARDLDRLKLNDEEERDFTQQVLGSALPELEADGVSWVRIQRITQYAYTAFAFSPEAAREAAERGVFEGKVTARGNRAERRASGKAPKARPASTATKTPRVK